MAPVNHFLAGCVVLFVDGSFIAYDVYKVWNWAEKVGLIQAISSHPKHAEVLFCATVVEVVTGVVTAKNVWRAEKEYRDAWNKPS